MINQNRPTQFVIEGKHPLLLLVRDHLIRSGFALTPCDDVDPEAPVFCLFGADGYANSVVGTTYTLHNNWPCLLLSSSSVYTDRDRLLNQLEIEPMDEAFGHVITSPLDASMLRPLQTLIIENQLTLRPEGRTMVVRPFNVYGPNVNTGVVHKFLHNTGIIPVHMPGRQIRTFLYEEDFLQCVDLLLAKLLGGSRGIYNVGSTEQVEILSLAKSVQHALGAAGEEIPIELVESDRRHNWWKLPSVDRVRADTRWRSKTSLRTGLFRMTEGK